MDFWFNLKKARKEQFPECYSFLLEDSRELLNMALTVSKEEHEERMQKCKELVNTYQYAVGGELLHRGYYCPSPVKDIVMGNCNRGKRIKHPIKFEQKMMYEYGFCDDQLLLIKHNIDDQIIETEYISYTDSKQIGCTFNSEMKLRTISECIYNDDKLTSYFLVNLDSFNSITSCEKEIYEYKNGWLHSATLYMMQTANSCLHDKYIFSHDSDGYLSSYKVVEYENGNIKEDFYWKDHSFKVTKKRRI